MRNEIQIEDTAHFFGATTKQVKDAIHAVKRNGEVRAVGGRNNPDIMVDDAGEVYVQMPAGSPSSDSVGNILDFLPEPRD